MNKLKYTPMILLAFIFSPLVLADSLSNEELQKKVELRNI